LICDRWDVFENFHADMGDPPAGLSLDRKNNDEGYSPSNCRWATFVEQNNNKRDNRRIEMNGETRTMTEWLRHYGLNYTTYASRVKIGMSPQLAILTPLQRGKKLIESKGFDAPAGKRKRLAFEKLTGLTVQVVK
jgi:hypothetical protein